MVPARFAMFDNGGVSHGGKMIRELLERCLNYWVPSCHLLYKPLTRLAFYSI